MMHVPPLKDSHLRLFLEQLQNRIATYEQGNTSITQQALIESGVLESDGQGGVVIPTDFIPNGSNYNPYNDYGAPDPPVNLHGMGALNSITLNWANSTNQSKVSHVEVWRSTIDDLGSAQLHAVTPGGAWADTVLPGEHYFYWVRNVSYTGVYSDFNQLGGFGANTANVPDVILEYVSGLIQATHLNTSLREPINAVPGIREDLDNISLTVADQNTVLQAQASAVDGLGAQWTVKTDVNGRVAGYGLATEPNQYNSTTTSMIFRVDRFAVGYPGVDDFTFIIDGNGVLIDGAKIKHATITNAQIGNVAADKIFAASGTMAEAFIGVGDITNAMIGNVIQSNNYVPGESGWRLDKNDLFEVHNIWARGNIMATSLAAHIVTADHIIGGAISHAESRAATVANLPPNTQQYLYSFAPNIPQGARGRALVVVSYRGSASSSSNIGALVVGVGPAGGNICGDQITAPAGNTVSGATTGAWAYMNPGDTIDVYAWNGWSSGMSTNVQVTTAIFVSLI